MDRTGRNHNTVHNTAVPVYSNHSAAIAGQHQSGLHTFGRALGAGHRTKCRQRSGARRFRRGKEAEKRVRTAVEPLLPENLWNALEHGGRVPWVEAHESWRTRRQYEPAHGGTTGASRNVNAVGVESVLRADTGIVIARRPDDSAAS